MRKTGLKLFVILLPYVFLISCEKNNGGEDAARFSHCPPENAFVNTCDSLFEMGISNKFQFSILPGTEEWNELTSHQKDSALQIPYELIGQMCTHDLVETCFDYPVLWHVTIYEHFSSWWSNMDTTFNGFNELLERCDAPPKMLKKYLAFDKYPNEYLQSELTLKKAIRVELIFMEMFLAHEKIITKFTNNELLYICEKAKTLWHLKNLTETDFNISPTYTCFLLGRAMYYSNYNPLIQEMAENKDLENFILDGSYVFYYDNSYEFIIQHIDLFVEQL